MLNQLGNLLYAISGGLFSHQLYLSLAQPRHLTFHYYNCKIRCQPCNHVLPLRDDLARAIKKLKALGGGFAVLLIGGKRLVQCVPGELSMDHTTVIQKAEVRRERWG